MLIRQGGSIADGAVAANRAIVRSSRNFRLKPAPTSRRQCEIDKLDGPPAIAATKRMTGIPDPGNEQVVAGRGGLALWDPTVERPRLGHLQRLLRLPGATVDHRYARGVQVIARCWIACQPARCCAPCRSVAASRRCRPCGLVARPLRGPGRMAPEPGPASRSCQAMRQLQFLHSACGDVLWIG